MPTSWGPIDLYHPLPTPRGENQIVIQHFIELNVGSTKLDTPIPQKTNHPSHNDWFISHHNNSPHHK